MRREDAERLLTETAPDLLAYFRRRVADPEDAADLVNDTVVAAWRAVTRIPRDQEQARMWLFGVARNTLRHHGRTRARRDALTTRLALSLNPDVWQDDAEGIEVRAAIAMLPEELAELIRLVHWDGFSLEQAAILTRTRPSTVRTRHARAKQLLKAALTTPAEHRSGQPTRTR